MSGSGDKAQLALMDAIVFFLVAMAVSAVMFSTLPGTEDDLAPGGHSWFDADQSLSAVLRSSLGTEVQVTVGGEPLVLPQRAEIAECVLLEAHVIAGGDGDHDFTALDAVMFDVVVDVCGASMKARIVVFEVRNGTAVELFAISHVWSAPDLVYAATSELADSQGGSFLVQLLSAPAS